MGRLDQFHAQWAGWESSVAAVRSEWLRPQQADHVPDLQRHAEMAQDVLSHFTFSQLLRVKALLQPPDL